MVNSMSEHIYKRENPYEKEDAFSSKSVLIWHPEEGNYFQPSINSFCLFRKSFNVEEGLCYASLKIMADSKYQLFINGRYIARGPCRSDPRWQYYDQLDILKELKQGKNVIAVHALYYGYGTGQSINSMHCLLAESLLTYENGKSERIGTDGSWKCIFSPAYDRTAPRVNGRQGPIEIFDADKHPGTWTSIDFDDSSWLGAVNIKARGPFWNLIERDIPMLKEEEVSADKITGFGELNEYPYDDKKINGQIIWEVDKLTMEKFDLCIPSEGLHLKQLPKEKVVALTVDFGKVQPGYFQMEAEGKAGTVIDVVYAEDLWQGKPVLDTSNHPIDRFILKDGKNSFEIAFGWKAFRYVLLIVRGNVTDTVIHRIGMRTRRYDLAEIGKFNTTDERLKSIYNLCKYTLNICMQDGFMDSPSREQQQWMGDARWQAVFNYYISGDKRLHRKLLEQIGHSQDWEGMVRARHPDGHINIPPIPQFCLSWITSFSEYYMYTGSDELMRKWWPNILHALRWFTAYENKDNLLQDVPYWMFIDWSLPPISLDVNRGGIITILNLVYLEAVKAAVSMAEAIGDVYSAEFFKGKADKLSYSINELLWSKSRKAFIDCVVNGEQSTVVSEAANALALLHLDTLGKERAGDIHNNVFSLNPPEFVVKPSPYMQTIILRALMRTGRKKYALDIIRDRYGYILDHGATTTWEEWELFKVNRDGSAHIRSASHAWGAGGILFFFEGILGIRPLAPGFKVFEVLPDLCGLDKAEGKIPTPYGTIEIKLVRSGDKINVSLDVPNGCIAISGKIARGPDKHNFTINSIK